MFCSNCSIEIRNPNQNYCSNCGSKIQITNINFQNQPRSISQLTQNNLRGKIDSSKHFILKNESKLYSEKSSTKYLIFPLLSIIFAIIAFIMGGRYICHKCCPF